MTTKKEFNISIDNLFKATDVIEVLGRDLGFHDIEINFNTVTLFVSTITLKRINDDMGDYLANTEYVLNHYSKGYNRELDGHWSVVRFKGYTFVFVDMFKKEEYKKLVS